MKLFRKQISIHVGAENVHDMLELLPEKRPLALVCSRHCGSFLMSDGKRRICCVRCSPEIKRVIYATPEYNGIGSETKRDFATRPCERQGKKCEPCNGKEVYL